MALVADMGLGTWDAGRAALAAGIAFVGTAPRLGALNAHIQPGTSWPISQISSVAMP